MYDAAWLRVRVSMSFELPFKDPELWAYLRSNSYRSKQYRLLYVATPKVACTTLKWWFASLVGLSKDAFSVVESDESDPDLIIHDTFREVAPTVTGLEPEQLIEPLVSDAYFRFAVVRNPYARIFSAWQSKLLLREPLQSESFIHCEFFNRSIRDGADIAAAYEGFLEHLLELDVTHLDAHWKSQVDLLRPDIISYSKIARLEDVDELTAALAAHVGTGFELPLRDRPRNESLIPYSRKFVTNRAVEIIKEIYAKDFELFRYDTNPLDGRAEFTAAELNVAIRAVDLIRGRHARLREVRKGRIQGLARLTRDVAERDEEIAELKGALLGVRGELGEMRNALAAIYTSRSWRVTRPLRAVHGLVTNRRVLLGRGLQGVKEVSESLRQYGFVETLRKIGQRISAGGVSFRYSSVARVQVNDAHVALSEIRGASPKKFTLISMIKNERGIIETFAAHAIAMFDRVIFIDHQSTDGTGAYMRALADAYPQVECYIFDEPGYYQSEIMTWVVRNLIGSEEDGWIFFLDADEYLPFASRAECDRELAKYASIPVISMPWLNLVPLDLETGKIKGCVFMKPPKTAAHHKIAFQPRLIPLGEYVVAQGNHALLVGKGHRRPFPAEEAFPIYHLPIRTKLQLRDKIRHGVESYRKMGVDRGENLGFHWDDINRLMETSGLTDDLMADMISRYGEPMVPPYGKSINAMVQEGYAEIRLDICADDLQIGFPDHIDARRPDSSVSGVAGELDNSNSRRELPIVLDPERRTLKFRCG